MKIVKETLNEEFKEHSDPIHDLGIGYMPKIKKAMQGIIDLYGTGGKLEKIVDDDEFGYMVEIDFAPDMGGIYSITYNTEYGWTAGYADSHKPYNDSEECEDLDECVSRIEGWIEYAQDKNNDW